MFISQNQCVPKINNIYIYNILLARTCVFKLYQLKYRQIIRESKVSYLELIKLSKLLFE